MKISKKEEIDNAAKIISEASERDINMIGQPSAPQIVGIDHINETTTPQG